MPVTVVTATELITGQKMDVSEFLRRWEDLPDVKFAELIDGIVHVPSPLSLDHARHDTLIIGWLLQYAIATPGCECANNATWTMLDNLPQPDAFLRILPSHGGQSSDKGKYPSGAPELIVELCLTSTEVDFGPKLTLYERACVREYVTIELLRKRIVWRILEDGTYKPQARPEDGVLRSRIFPGLWLDVAAFWADDGAKMMAALKAGLETEEHRRFVASLAAKRIKRSRSLR
jgi:Uma2 family endonuclease